MINKDEAVIKEATKATSYFLMAGQQRVQHGKVTSWHRCRSRRWLYCQDKIADCWVDLKIPESYNELVMLYNKALTAQLNCGDYHLALRYYKKILVEINRMIVQGRIQGEKPWITKE